MSWWEWLLFIGGCVSLVFNLGDLIDAVASRIRGDREESPDDER